MRNKACLSYKERLQQIEELNKEDYMLEPKDPKKNSCVHFCKKLLTFMITRVGLTIILVGYVVAGGIFFEHLESENEIKSLKLSESVLQDLLKRIYKQIEGNSTRVKDESFHNFLSLEINNYRQFITNSTINGTLTENVEPQWDFFGAVFYCVTLISTIGYGHITCKTKYGKAFTIIYSAVGVPLMALFLANTGSSTATLYKFIYTRLNAFKRRSMKRKITRMKESFTKADIEKSSYDECMQPNQPVDDVDASNQSSKKSKISTKSFRFKAPDDATKVAKNKETQAEKKAKRGEKKQEQNGGQIQETSGIKLEKESNEKQRFDEAPRYETHKFESDVLKRMDGLIDGDNSLYGDNVSYSEIGQINRSETFENNLKSVIENDDSASTSSISDTEEIDNRRHSTNNRSSLIPNLFLIKTKNDVLINEQPQKSLIKSNVSNVSKCSSTNSETSPVNLTEASEPYLPPSNSTATEPNSNKPKNNKFKFFAKSFSGFNKKPSPATTTPLVTTETAQAMSVLAPLDTEPITTVSDLVDNSEEPSGQFSERKMSPVNYTRSKSEYATSSGNNKAAKTRLNQSTKTAKQSAIYTSKQLQLIYQQYQQEREKKNNVPICNVLCLIPIYLVMGMLFFSKMEDWRKLDAFYFCFTTMFTIGFGDFIPGTTLLNKNGNKKNMYISALYIFGGLILIAMVLNLVSKQLKIKVRRWARKIGLSNC